MSWAESRLARSVLPHQVRASAQLARGRSRQTLQPTRSSQRHLEISPPSKAHRLPQTSSQHARGAGPNVPAPVPSPEQPQPQLELPEARAPDEVRPPLKTTSRGQQCHHADSDRHCQGVWHSCSWHRSSDAVGPERVFCVQSAVDAPVPAPAEQPPGMLQ